MFSFKAGAQASGAIDYGTNMFSFKAGAQASGAIDYGTMWDAHHGNLRKLAREAGIPASWMRVDEHKPKSREDFITKIETNYYGHDDAGATDDNGLPNCVGLALTVQIRSGLHTKFRKEVTLGAVIAAIYSACPEMLDGGIQPSKAIEMCNKAHNGKGLLIPGATQNTVYWVRLTPAIFTHGEFGQAFTAVQRTEKLGCPPMVVMVAPSKKPPLHAMVAKGAVFLPGNVAAMSAFDIQCSQGQNEANITTDEFHTLIVCDIHASEQSGREAATALSAEAGFQRDFDSALKDSRRVKKPKQSYSCSIMACIRAQKDEECDPLLQDSIENVQKSFADVQERFHHFFEACAYEIMQAHDQGVERLRSIGQSQGFPAPAPAQADELVCEDAVVQAQDKLVAGSRSLVLSFRQVGVHAQSLRSDLAAMSEIASVRQAGMRAQSLRSDLAAMSEIAKESKQELVNKLDEILGKFDFDEETLRVFRDREGAHDIMRSIARKRGWKWCC